MAHIPSTSPIVRLAIAMMEEKIGETSARSVRTQVVVDSGC